MYCYHIVDAAGKKTIVGSQCVFKTLSEFDRTLTAEVRKLKAKADREAREAKNLARWAALAPRVDAARNILATRPTLFANLPHPNEYFASQGRTLRDYYEYCLNGGEAGRVLVCRAVESAVKGAPTSATKFVPSAKATDYESVQNEAVAFYRAQKSRDERSDGQVSRLAAAAAKRWERSAKVTP